MTTPGDNHYTPRPDRERQLPDRPRPHPDRPRGNPSTPARRRGKRGLAFVITAAVAAVLLIAGAVLYFFVDRRPADNNQAADPLHLEEGNYVIKPCAAQGDDIPLKLNQAIDAVKDEKTTPFIDGMKIAAFIAHNQQVTEDMLVQTLQGRRPELHYYGHGAFSEADHEEMVELLDIDYELEERALVQEVHNCFSLDANDTKELLSMTKAFVGVDDELVDDVIDNGGPEAPQPRVLLAAPEEVPAEYEEALERAREIMDYETPDFTNSNRVALFLNLLSGSKRYIGEAEYEEGKKYSVDAAIYAAEHVDADFPSDNRAQLSNGEAPELSIYSVAINTRTEQGESIPQIAANS